MKPIDNLSPLLVAIILACLTSNTLSEQPLIPTFDMDYSNNFEFKSNSHKLSGVFDTPSTSKTKALIMFIHGYGGTDVRGRNSFSSLRKRFNKIGIATAVWDKPGQGRSEGTFDVNQSVFSSAQEVVDAAKYFRSIKAPGSNKIGIWGVSRGGWIAPIALSKDPNISFWISVSGTTEEDNFSYYLLSNLPYEGGTKVQSKLFEDEWRTGCQIFRSGGSYGNYLAATKNLRANKFIKKLRGEWQTRFQYMASQYRCKNGSCPQTDNDLCSYIHIENFNQMLTNLNVDTLAIFGERDLNVDWKKTKSTYQRTIGNNPNATLKIVTFKDADHNLNVSETGSTKEMKKMINPVKSDGYYDVQVEWIRKVVLRNLQPNPSL